ncbi:MAG: hypothetical protein CVU56_29285 [Deltaproteobacteria bacterium HGW-Deltaproteobacteria-14]|jgi:GH25 family lysozyme M1 (1,4-beta-N-acetylmuramidase)|nr:MAG: hypothetical protein CVU56_29285 [Deltaproteobacteria bacterium HGW-Deltaproteobacteria-14]
MRPAHLLLLPALLGTLAACAAGDDTRPMQAGAPALFAAPVTTNVCPDGTTTMGIDVSKWQGTIDWGAVKNAGVRFAFIRVADGASYYDPQFQTNWANAKAAGIPRGAYQFFRADEDPVAQADLLISKINAYGAGELPPVVDVETTEGQSAATIANRVGQWLARVDSQLGVKGVVYAGSYFWEDNVGSAAFAGNPLWVAHWTSGCPTIPSQWADWTFHQYSATGSIPGISGDVDLDRFNGTVAELLQLVGSSECAADPAYAACDGAVMVRCDDAGHLTRSDCGTAGGECSAVGGLHCVDLNCWTNLSGGENGTYCTPTGALGTCTGGQYAEVACPSAHHCEGAAGSASCVAACATQGAYCASERVVGTCASGTYTETDCAADGRYCSAQSGTARCVDAPCAPGQGGAEDRTFCVDSERLGRCDAGAYTAAACPTGLRCFAVAGGAQCIDPSVPPVDESPVEDVAAPDVTGGVDAIAGDGGPSVGPVVIGSSASLRDVGGGCVGGGGGAPLGLAGAGVGVWLALARRRRGLAIGR